MAEETENNQQKYNHVPLPPFLIKRQSGREVSFFQIGGDNDAGYYLKMGDEVLCEFEAWEFDVLTAMNLYGGDKYESLLWNVNEGRKDRVVTESDVQRLFNKIEEKGLFDDEIARNNKLIIECRKLGEGKLNALNNDKNKPIIDDMLNVKKAKQKMVFPIYDPCNFLRKHGSKILLLKHIIHPLMVLMLVIFVVVVGIVVNNSVLVMGDVSLLLSEFNFLYHVLFSLLTVNLVVTIISGVVAHGCGATFSNISILLVFGFYPRFKADLKDIEGLEHHQKLWLYATPLLVRIGLFSLGIIIWYFNRHLDSILPQAFLALSFVCFISFTVTACPFITSNGYHFIAELLNEPHLKGKAFMVLLNKWHNKAYQQSDSNSLVIFGLVSFCFMVLLLVVFIALFYKFLVVQFGSFAIIGVVVLCIYSLNRIIKKIKAVDKVYHRNVQFNKWRDRTIQKGENDKVKKENKNVLLIYSKFAIPILFLIVMFLQYNYKTGGHFVILPYQRQEITSVLDGIVDEIHFDGDEILKKGTVIGRLSYSEYMAQVKILTAKMQEQQAVISELQSRPRPEEVQVAERDLEVANTQSKFSSAKMSRLEKLYEEKTISFEELDDARRVREVDLQQVEEKRAKLELTKLGVTPDQIAAAEAKLLSWQEERDYNQEMIEKSFFYMPFDGNLLAMHLKQKIGSYLNKGQPLCIAENTGQMFAQIDVPESDIGFVVVSADIRGRCQAYHNVDFTGVVVAIDANVTKTNTGNVVKVATLIENKDGRIKTGMTGYAKISSKKMPVWKVLSLSIVRFFKVEVWSWFP